MLKKICSSFISIIMLVSLTSLSVLLILRTILSGDVIGTLFGNVMNATSGENYLEKIVEPINSKEYAELNKYFDVKEFEKVIGNYASDILIYQGQGLTGEKPDTTELKKYFQDTISKYEKDNNVDIDTSGIDEIIDNIEMEVEKTDIFQGNTYIKDIFDLIYSKIDIVLIAIIIICLIIILLINRSIIKTLKYLSIALILNGLSILLLGLALSYVIKNLLEKPIAMNTINIIKYEINKNGFINLGLGIIILIIVIISSIIIKHKKSKSISNSEEQIQITELNNSLNN